MGFIGFVELLGLSVLMKFERFEDVEAWQRARKLTRKVYRLIENIVCERQRAHKTDT